MASSSRTRDLAYWLQDKIYREGLEPVGFMAASERWAKRNASDEVEKHLRRNLK